MNHQNLTKRIQLANEKVRKLLPTIQALSCLAVIASAIVQIGLNLGWVNNIQAHPNSSPTHPPLEQVQPSHKP